MKGNVTLPSLSNADATTSAFCLMSSSPSPRRALLGPTPSNAQHPSCRMGICRRGFCGACHNGSAPGVPCPRPRPLSASPPGHHLRQAWLPLRVKGPVNASHLHPTAPAERNKLGACTVPVGTPPLIREHGYRLPSLCNHRFFPSRSYPGGFGGDCPRRTASFLDAGPGKQQGKTGLCGNRR